MFASSPKPQLSRSSNRSGCNSLAVKISIAKPLFLRKVRRDYTRKWITARVRGYILNLKKRGNEDMIVTLLSTESLLTLYRFYGARHSALQLGYKIDFIVENNPFFMPRLRQVAHLSFEWLFSLEKARVWQRFCQLLYAHLRGAEECGGFYYDMLENAAGKLKTQNPKRTMIESAAALLEHEGRLHSDMRCFICREEIKGGRVALLRGCSPAHAACVGAEGFDLRAVKRLFEAKESLLFADPEIKILWKIVESGL
ncbi:MAG: recombination protein RecO [Helicobacteraceae bacterium]|nr:recombination protein RecO [Helicobacteraceae bacterium]